MVHAHVLCLCPTLYLSYVQVCTLYSHVFLRKLGLWLWLHMVLAVCVLYLRYICADALVHPCISNYTYISMALYMSPYIHRVYIYIHMHTWYTCIHRCIPLLSFQSHCHVFASLCLHVDVYSYLDKVRIRMLHFHLYLQFFLCLMFDDQFNSAFCI